MNSWYGVPDVMAGAPRDCQISAADCLQLPAASGSRRPCQHIHIFHRDSAQMCLQYSVAGFLTSDRGSSALSHCFWARLACPGPLTALAAASRSAHGDGSRGAPGDELPPAGSARAAPAAARLNRLVASS